MEEVLTQSVTDNQMGYPFLISAQVNDGVNQALLE